MTNPPIYQHLFRKLTEVYERGPDSRLRDFEIPVDRYTDPRLFEKERALLRAVPIPVAHVSQLTAAGSCLVHDALGVAEHTGYPPESVYKTLVVEVDDPDHKPLLVMVDATSTLDLKRDS